MNGRLSRTLPEPLRPLEDIALDLRWTGSQTASRIWRRLDPEMWERTRNPLALLMNAHQERLEAAAGDETLLAELETWLSRMRRLEAEPTWFGEVAGEEPPRIAYFSMEFGLSEALPIYSGGLGMLAGDHLKTASSLGVPLVGVGLLYQQGYFRQIIGDDGRQIESYPYNEPGSLPISPVEGSDGRWPRVRLELPGRTLLLRLWEARVGAVRLILLDSNDPMNGPRDRSITAQLYRSDRETRLLQELVLGAGGWMALEKLGLHPEVCHLNEGHAAFAVVARAAAFAEKEDLPFATALWATRAGNVFTTHTPVAAAFDRFEARKVAETAGPWLDRAGVPEGELLALGREPGPGGADVFNLAFLAMRGSARVNGVSRLHGETSRRLFAPLFPRWPLAEVPVAHVTNGVHVPTWDSAAANDFWRQARPENWSRHLPEAAAALRGLPDEEWWAFRTAARTDLVEDVRSRLVRRCRERCDSPEETARCAAALDPEVLTIGFARRFTGYKRPGLLLRDPDRLAALLGSTERPVQLLMSGKAHPDDPGGAAMVREAANFWRREDVRGRAVFLEDYDMAVAQTLVGGVDVWLNNPLRPNEACGTSGMKALVNGCLHLSTPDGWWDEAYGESLGWVFGGEGSDEEEDAEELYRLLEREIVPEFYERDAQGLPRRWLERVKASATVLVPRFSSDRMLREYAERCYVPAAAAFRRRRAGRAAAARDLAAWEASVSRCWEGVRFGARREERVEGRWRIEVELALGGLPEDAVRVELYREDGSGQGESFPMALLRHPAHGGDFAIYLGGLPDGIPASDCTARVRAAHPEAAVPGEAPWIRWQD